MKLFKRYLLLLVIGFLPLLSSGVRRLVLAQTVTDTPTNSPTSVPPTSIPPTDTPADTPTATVTPTEAVTPTDIPPTSVPTTAAPTDTITPTIATESAAVTTITGTPLLTVTPILSITETPTNTISTGNASSDSNTSNTTNSTTNQPTGVSTNTASVGTSVSGSASSGDNTVTTTGKDKEVVVVTGDATTYANLVNLVNTTANASTIKVIFLNLDNGASGDIDLNAQWQAIVNSGISDGVVIDPNNSLVNLFVGNSATVNNQVSVNASSGNNVVGSGNGTAVINTGNATGVANVINLVNAQLWLSHYFMGVINIGNFSGNLILPRPQALTLTSNGTVVMASNNQANVTNNVSTNASSGSNSTNSNGQSTITTGDAGAIANQINVVNVSGSSNQQYLITVNNTGGWSGDVLNWLAPGSIQQLASQTSQMYYVGLTSPDYLPWGGMMANNQANVTNTILVNAQTGNNTINQGDGSALIATGNANSVANLYNFVNLQLRQSNWFYGLVNVVGSWKGKIIFAYPDLMVGVDPKETTTQIGNHFSFTVHYTNQGYDVAHGTRLVLDLPKGISYLSDGSLAPHEQNGDELSWDLGTLAVGGGSSFQVTVSVDPDLFNQAGVTDHWFIKPVFADQATNEKQLITSASISSSDPEQDLSNNTTSMTVDVPGPVAPMTPAETPTEAGIDHRQPTVDVEAKNNVGAYVNPTDVVSFDVLVKNTSDVALFNGVLHHQIYDPQGTLVFSNSLSLGQINAGKSGTIRFGIPLSQIFGQIEPVNGEYQTQTYVSGNANDTTNYTSNQSTTHFTVRVLGIKTTAGTVLTTPGSPGTILGTKNEVAPPTNVFPYLLLLLSSSGWLWAATRKFGTLATLSLQRLSMVLIIFGIFLYSFYQLVSLSKHSYTVTIPSPASLATRAIDRIPKL